MSMGGGRDDPRDAPSARRVAETVKKVAQYRGVRASIRRTTIKKRKKRQTLGERVGVVGQAVRTIFAQPSETAMATGVPVAGIGTRVAAPIIRTIPGIGRFLGRPDVAPRLGNVGRAIAAAGTGALLAEGIDYLQGVQRGIGEGGTAAPGMFPRSLAIPSGGAPVAMQPMQPLGPLARGQEFPGGPFVVKSWDTYPGRGVTGGGSWPIFSLLSDGRIVVQSPNGAWKVYRPKKNLVISSNPRLRDIRKLDRMHKRVTKMIKSIVPRPRSRK